MTDTITTTKPGVLASLDQATAALSQNATFPADAALARTAITEARVTVERLADAAKLALEMRWLGDDKPESSPVYRALTAALAAFHGEQP